MPLASFFPALGPKGGVIFLGFVKNAPAVEIVVSIDACSLRLHEFCPFRHTAVVGAEILRLDHAAFVAEPGFISLLTSNFTALIAAGVVITAQVCKSRYTLIGTRIRIFCGGELIHERRDDLTTEHILYKMDYLEDLSPFILTYRLPSCNVGVLSSISDFLEEHIKSGNFAFTKKRQTIFVTQFKGLEYAQQYISEHYPEYFIEETGQAIAVPGPPSSDFLQVPIIFYLPLERSKVTLDSTNKKKHLILILSFYYHSGKVLLERSLDAELIIAGSQKLDFVSFCAAKRFEATLRSTVFYCRDKLCEDNLFFIAQESYCTVLSNYWVARNVESWYIDIDHPSLPITIYNDELIHGHEMMY